MPYDTYYINTRNERMPWAEDGVMVDMRQRLALDERKELLVSGVKNVDSFDENRIELNSTLGGIDICGAGLKIAALNLNEGRVTISGQIDSIAYVKSREEKSVRHKSKNVMARLLK